MDGIRGSIRDKLRSSPIFQDALRERPELRDEHPDEILRYLEDRGLLDSLFVSLEADLHDKSNLISKAPQGPVVLERHVQGSLPVQASGADPSSDQCRLHVRISHCKACLDFLDPRDYPRSMLRWHVAFGAQRLRTRSVRACVDPVFNESFLLNLPVAPDAPRALLTTGLGPVHLLLVREDPLAPEGDVEYDSRDEVLSSHFLEWRNCLAQIDPLPFTVELHGIGRRQQLAVGVLHCELEVVPRLNIGLAKADVEAQIRAEEQGKADASRSVFETLDRWWQVYHPVYTGRNVKLFAQTENRIFHPVTAFVTPLEAGRALETPLHALRWVSLMSTDQPSPADTEPCWHTLPALWVRRRGSLEERAILLCSLLLGYSFDAWVCLGSDGRGASHCWVVVRDRADASTPVEVTCWDPLHGSRIRASEPEYLTSYSCIDTVFNHRRLYIGKVTSIAHARYDFGDPRFWIPSPLDAPEASMPGALKLYVTSQRTPYADLRPRSWPLPLDNDALEEVIERRLSEAVRVHRNFVGVQTKWDSHMSYLLHVALANYELERIGGPSQSDLFENLIRRICVPSEVFRAIPAQFDHLRLELYWPALRSRSEDLLSLPASATFALRAKVIPYPEGITACWVLLGVKSTNVGQH